VQGVLAIHLLSHPLKVSLVVLVVNQMVLLRVVVELLSLVVVLVVLRVR
jgi:hypothetical protein